MTCLVVGSYANASTGQVNLEAGYRRDNISWKHRFPSHDPVVSSSHKFKDLDIFQIGANARATLGCNFYLRANAYWGWILDGEYERDVNTFCSDSSRSDFHFGFSNDKHTVIDDRFVYGVGAAIGYPFFFCDCTTVVAPVIGYSFDEQSVQFEGGRFNFCNSSSSYCGSCDCCEQTFNSRWYGPFVGIDFNYRPYNECWDVYADIEYHWGSFRGKRSGGDGFDFFDHSDRSSHDATGWVFDIGADYDLCNCWTVGFSLQFKDWTANRNHRVCGYSSDDYCFSHSDCSCNDRARTNHKWHSYAINLTVGKEF